MNRSRLVGLWAAGVLAGAAVASAYSDQDWQFWQTDGVEYKIDDNWKAKADVEFYLGDHMSDWYYRHVDVGLSYRVTDWLTAGAGYRYVEQKKSDDWDSESRPYALGEFIWKPCGWRIADRNQGEFRSRESASDMWRYRNRLQIASPWQWTSVKIQPYVSEEAFIDSDADRFNENRAIGGFTAKLLPHLNTDLYYMLQSKLSKGEWTEVNVLGLKLVVPF